MRVCGLSGKPLVALGICFCVFLIITIGLIAGSFAILTPQEYGLKYNSITITLDDDKVYNSGRIYVGVGGSFYKYPRKLSYVEFVDDHALDVWSADGQSITLEASFYYKFREDKIHDIFYTYGVASAFHEVMLNVASETLRVRIAVC